MRSLLAAVLCFLVPTSLGALPATNSTPIYYAQAGLQAPVLLAPAPGDQTPPLPAPDHCKKMNGKVAVSVLVDPEGKPHDAMLVAPQGSELDYLAIRQAMNDHFQPATLNGQPVAVAARIEMKLKGCYTKSTDANGKPTESLKLRANPEQKIWLQPQPAPEEQLVLDSTPSAPQEIVHLQPGKDTPPRVLKAEDPSYSEAGRAAKINGICLIKLVVDKYGLPQNLRIVRSIEPGMDRNAIIAVSHYRFRPALREGRPMAVEITVEVKFSID